MTAELKELATVQMGLAFRARPEPEKGGNTLVIQMRDLTEGNRLDVRHLLTVQLNDVNAHHFVRRKDLIFRSRGKTTTTALIDAEPERTVVAAPLLRIRVASGKVLPEYLLWFINQPLSQAFLHRRATGTAMVTIGKSVLEALEISLPDMETQKRIAAIAALSEREQRLMRALAENKKRLADGILMRLARESEASRKQRELAVTQSKGRKLAPFVAKKEAP